MQPFFYTNLMKKIKRVYLEITNICNLTCSFCIRHGREYKSMSLDQIRYAIHQIKDVSEYIYLHVQGEPLLHPKLEEIFEILDEYNMKVQLVTNGSLLKNNFWLLKKKCLRKISFSAHSLDEQNTNPEDWLNVVFDFMSQASLQQSPYCEIRFWNQNNLSKCSKEAIQWISERYHLTETSRKGSWKIMNKCYLHYDNQFSWPENTGISLNTGTCHGGVDMIAILVDGTVVPCCLDAKGIIQLGNIFKTSLTDIMESNRYLQMVQGFKNHKITEELCKHCTYRHRFIKQAK